jgi:prepilin-type N-terminal cleavage/methylation domain-containing protein
MRRRFRLFSGPGPAGFTLIELIAVLVLMGVLAIFCGQLLTTPIQGYIQARSADEVVQKAQMALQRMTVELSYIDRATTTGTPTSLNYNGNVVNAHAISLNGTNLVYTQDGQPYTLADGLAAGGLLFTYYNTFNSPAAANFSSATNIIGISLTMHGDDWSAGLNKTFSTRVTIKNF